MRFERRGDCTILAERSHDGPLVVQKPLYPEGRDVCHVVLVHAPGGIAGGDELSLGVSLDPSARALVTTPAATRWYKSAGAASRVESQLDAATGAILEWLPSETIVFDEADAHAATVVRLDA